MHVFQGLSELPLSAAGTVLWKKRARAPATQEGLEEVCLHSRWLTCFTPLL